MFEKDKINLLSAMEAINKINEYSKDYNNADAFYKNTRDFDASLMNFIIIGEMVARLDEKLLKQYNQIDWKNIKNFRNIVAHNYFGIDAEEVWDIIQAHLPKLKDDLNSIIQNLG